MILDVPYNFHWIEAGQAARAAQAYAGFLGPFLRAHGIRSIVNLRGSNPRHIWWRYETRACAAAGIVHFDVRLNSRQLPAKAMLLDLVGAFDDLPRPLLLKCSGGQDRTSFAAALFLLHSHGWDACARADAQFSFWPYLHRPQGTQRWLQLFVAFARDGAAGRTLERWLIEDYSAEGFRAWLEARGEHHAFAGLYGAKRRADNA